MALKSHSLCSCFKRCSMKYLQIFPQVQTRSADEPMTTFVYCQECGNRWKVCLKSLSNQPRPLALLIVHAVAWRTRGMSPTSGLSRVGEAWDSWSLGTRLLSNVLWFTINPSALWDVYLYVDLFLVLLMTSSLSPDQDSTTQKKFLEFSEQTLLWNRLYKNFLKLLESFSDVQSFYILKGLVMCDEVYKR